MASEDTKTPYEQQRDERIARNRQVLADIGVAEAWKEAYRSKNSGKTQGKKMKRESGQAPVRKSARLDPDMKKEFEDHEKTAEETRKRLAVPPKRLEELQETDAEAVYRHNLMRLKSMSTPAMQRRIRKIMRVDKMESLILVLKDAEKDELLKQAEEALQELLEQET